MRSKTKTNRASLARFFPRLAPVTCICFEFWLVHCIVYVFLWLVGVITLVLVLQHWIKNRSISKNLTVIVQFCQTFWLERDSNPWPLRYRCSAVVIVWIKWKHFCTILIKKAKIHIWRYLKHSCATNFPNIGCNCLNFLTAHHSQTIFGWHRKTRNLFFSALTLCKNRGGQRTLEHKSHTWHRCCCFCKDILRRVQSCKDLALTKALPVCE